MKVRAKTVRGSTRVLAFSLVVLFVLFFAQVATHSHENGQNEASCQICHGAHIATAPVASTLALHTFIAFESIRPSSITFYPEFFFSDCASRAPPCVTL
jgi:hypothetical protein